MKITQFFALLNRLKTKKVVCTLPQQKINKLILILKFSFWRLILKWKWRCLQTLKQKLNSLWFFVFFVIELPVFENHKKVLYCIVYSIYSILLQRHFLRVHAMIWILTVGVCESVDSGLLGVRTICIVCESAAIGDNRDIWNADIDWRSTTEISKIPTKTNRRKHKHKQ